MIILGLTGAIGMGKSLTAAMLRKQGCAVHNADAVVHRLLGPGGSAVVPVGAAFPDVLRHDARGHAFIDRRALGAIVFGAPEHRQALETILHPLVQQAEQAKRARAQASGRRVLVLDIPLLFETGGEERCDKVLCVTAPAATQRRRVLARPGMTPEKFAQILAAQWTDAEKRARADYVISTGYGRLYTWCRLKGLLRRLAG